MIIETVVFSLAPGAAEVDVLAHNDRYQEAVAYQTPGMLRRTVARGDDGEWIEVLLWADDADRVMQGDPDVRASWEDATTEVSRRTWRGL